MEIIKKLAFSALGFGLFLQSCLGNVAHGDSIKVYDFFLDGTKLPVSRMKTKEFKIGGFDEIFSSGAIKVKVIKSSEERAVVTGSDLENVSIDVQDGKLVIGYKSLDRFLFHQQSDVVITHVTVYAKSLRNFFVSSSSKMFVGDNMNLENQGFYVSSAGEVRANPDVHRLDIFCSSSGRFEGEIRSKQLHSEVNSAGRIRISGEAGLGTLLSSSAGEIDGKYLVLGRANLHASSAGKVQVQVKEGVKAVTQSRGKIGYKTLKPNVEVTTSSATGGKIYSY